jgi:indole-3-acetate monooxygenase
MATIVEKLNQNDLSTLQEKIIQLRPVLEKTIEEDDINRQISDSIIQALRTSGLHQLFMPESLGGLEADPLTVAKLVEQVASIHTAAGWSMMVANVSTWWCGRLPEKGIEEIYKEGPHTLIAGAFHPPMAAEPVNGGYRINGRSPLTSNVHAARWVFVTAFVMENGQIKMNHGTPEIVGVFMDAKDCRIIDTWHTIGLKATDSNDIAADNVFVPSQLSFVLMPEYKRNEYYEGPLYRFPAIGASTACLIAPVALAVASNAIREIRILAEKKTSFGSMVPLRERGVVQSKLGKAEALVQSGRAYLHGTLADLWKKTLAGETISIEEKAGVLLAATHANQSSLQAVDLMYSAAGTTAIYTRNKLSRLFSDAQVIRQHGFANDSRYETAAQVLLGLQSDLPVLAF